MLATCELYTFLAAVTHIPTPRLCPQPGRLFSSLTPGWLDQSSMSARPRSSRSAKEQKRCSLITPSPEARTHPSSPLMSHTSPNCSSHKNDLMGLQHPVPGLETTADIFVSRFLGSSSSCLPWGLSETLPSPGLGIPGDASTPHPKHLQAQSLS